MLFFLLKFVFAETTKEYYDFKFSVLVNVGCDLFPRSKDTSLEFTYVLYYHVYRPVHGAIQS